MIKKLLAGMVLSSSAQALMINGEALDRDEFRSFDFSNFIDQTITISVDTPATTGYYWVAGLDSFWIRKKVLDAGQLTNTFSFSAVGSGICSWGVYSSFGAACLSSTSFIVGYVGIDTGSGDAFFDNVNLAGDITPRSKNVPLPSSLYLLAIGIGVLLGFKRKL